MNVSRQVGGAWLAAAFLMMSGCGSQAEVSRAVTWDDRPESVIKGKEIHHFESLGEMVATADVVVVGTVGEARRGGWYGDPGAPDSTRARLVDVQVEKVLWAAGGRRVEGSLAVANGSWGPEGIGYMTEGVRWLEPGERGLFALQEAESGEALELLNSQSQFVLGRAGVEPSGDAEGDLAAQWRGKPVAAFLTAADKGAHDAATGAARPDTKGEPR